MSNIWRRRNSTPTADEADAIQVAGRVCGGNHHPGSIPSPSGNYPASSGYQSCIIPKLYWVRSNPGTALPGEVNRCLTGPRRMEPLDYQKKN
ncbi:hypothetical protein YC2023_035831 [Brassica napus]